MPHILQDFWQKEYNKEGKLQGADEESIKGKARHEKCLTFFRICVSMKGEKSSRSKGLCG